MLNIFSKLLDSNEKEITRLNRLVEQINQKSGDINKLSDKQLRAKTAEFKSRLENGQTLDEILPEAFATVREASYRTIGERHYDVQLMAAIALHQGKIAEQRTGEGKTLSAVPALYLNALTGKGSHLVTVNDYLARRDCGWMGAIFSFLDVSVSAIIHEASYLYDPESLDNSASDWRLMHLRQIKRREAYRADVTYGINSEFGFDYLRDNMVSDINDTVQREHHYAIVDEVDSILIDEARTPHIISAPDTEPTKKYYDYARMVDKLTGELDYQVDEKLRTAHLTEHGISKIEKMLGVENLYEKDFATVHHVENALKARTLFHKDRDYVVKDNEVIIVDEFTGRLMFGRRFGEGLHQAIEAKENVSIQQESRTLATISLQNYFRMYEKLAGMTGTAATEAEEFHKIYNLEVISIPTNKPLIRKDMTDLVYKTGRAKYAAVVAEIEQMHKIGRPVLVGTTSIEKNELLSQFLNHKGIKHEILNAKNHEKEAAIIANAGEKGAVTVATNMAGRGVDIILGGPTPSKQITDSSKERTDNKEQTTKNNYDQEYNKWQKNHEEVVKLGGLHVIGTERHESRRIDNQLRGRSGRQGDPGSSRFFVALDDDVMRLFGGDQVAKLMNVFKLPENIPLEHPMVSRAIEQAQVKVETFNFDTRKHLVEYDDVMNKQREIVYKARRKVLENAKDKERGLKTEILEKVDKEINLIVSMHAPEGYQEIEREKIIGEFVAIIPFDQNSQDQLNKQLAQFSIAPDISGFLKGVAKDVYEQREKQLGQELMSQVESWVNLSVIDKLWMDHLDAIDDLREGIGLRGYGQRDPLVEYKQEAFSLFETLMAQIDSEIVHRIYKVQVQIAPDQLKQMQQEQERLKNQAVAQSASTASAVSTTSSSSQSAPVSHQKIGRNDPCWCGSGKKWKKCHYPQLPK
ncbi:MAG: preprotein translocase subunit SecA [Patescibacteria group bacterium]|nr:preprotein translocase subunit SecA [Patescibacteria group bacterium]